MSPCGLRTIKIIQIQKPLNIIYHYTQNYLKEISIENKFELWNNDFKDRMQSVHFYHSFYRSF